MKKLLLGLLLLSSMAFVETDLLGQCVPYGKACGIYSGNSCCGSFFCNGSGDYGVCN